MKKNNQPRTNGVLQIGDIVTRHPVASTGKQKGIVEYIHSKGRFHAVRFGVGSDSYLECFWGNMVKKIC